MSTQPALCIKHLAQFFATTSDLLNVGKQGTRIERYSTFSRGGPRAHKQVQYYRLLFKHQQIWDIDKRSFQLIGEVSSWRRTCYCYTNETYWSHFGLNIVLNLVHGSTIRKASSVALKRKNIKCDCHYEGVLRYLSKLYLKRSFILSV